MGIVALDWDEDTSQHLCSPFLKSLDMDSTLPLNGRFEYREQRHKQAQICTMYGKHNIKLHKRDFTKPYNQYCLDVLFKVLMLHHFSQNKSPKSD